MTAESHTIDPEVTRLLREAAEWRLLGLLFEYPTPFWRQSLTALLPDLVGTSLRSMAEAALAYHTEGLQIALFGPSGSVPVREVAYQGGVQSGYLMSELAAYYTAFGYSASTEEAVDHLAIELGFLSYLKMKQALAIARGESDQAALSAEAAASFSKDHLAMVAEPVSHLLPSFAPDYLTEAGRLLAERVGPAPRSGYPLASPSIGDDDSFGCGADAAEPGLIPLMDIHTPG